MRDPNKPSATGKKIGAPLGNTNATKQHRLWRDALLRHTAQNPEELKKIAAKVFDLAKEGDMMAVKEIGDRLDGKPVQQVHVEDPARLGAAIRERTDMELLAIIEAAQRGKPDGETAH